MLRNKETWDRGKIWENEMIEIHHNFFKGEVKRATRREDMMNHIDFWWRQDENSKWFSFDIKAVKKAKRNGELDDTINWIEIKNIRGNPGWIYGKEDYVIFATEQTAIYVARHKLVPYIEEKILGKELVHSTPKEFYIPYRRFGVQDTVVKVPTSDLRTLKDYEIKFT